MTAMLDNVISMPVRTNINMFRTGLKFIFNTGEVVPATARAYINVYDRDGNITDTFYASASGKTFVWNVDFGRISFIEHGASYRLYVKTATQRGGPELCGKLIWIGR